ncbi:MAG: ferric reductase-like transmembrane domain-containing protein [Candidatus Micrarchaeaceae archaeon]
MKRLGTWLAAFALVFGIVSMPAWVYAAPIGTSTVPPIGMVADGTSVAQQVVIKTKASWSWYATRASGLVAAFLLVLLILSGIGQVTGMTYRVIEPLNAWRLHRALGIAFGVSVIVHIVVLLFDKFAPFTVLQVLLPFTSTYMPVTIGGWHLGSLYVALGVLAMYASAIVLLTSLFWIDKKPFLWRLMHYLSYLLVVLIFFHGLFIGTDTRHGLTRVIWLAFGLLILAGFYSRLRRAWTITHRDKQ